MSRTSSPGLPSVSPNSSRVSGRIAARQPSRSPGRTKVVVQRRLAARGRDRAAAAFERRDALLEDGVGRVRDPAVDVSRALHVEERRGVLARLEHERGRQVNRHRACAGGRVGRGAGVDGEGVEAWIGGAGHGARGRLLATIVG